MAETTEIMKPASQTAPVTLPKEVEPVQPAKVNPEPLNPASQTAPDMIPKEVEPVQPAKVNPEPLKPPSNPSTAKPVEAKTIPAPKKKVLAVRSPITKVNDPPPSYTSVEVFIAVMGQTGTGKTTFINNATGSKLIVGGDMDSCTSEISLASTVIDEQLVTLIDTPGFDDSGKDDVEILQTIGRYLKATYDENILLTGVIYLHRITDNRMQGSSLKSLNILKTLCGHEYYNNIALATTMWSTIVDTAEGEKREAQLITRMEYWKEMIAEGAKVFRYNNKAEGAKEIVRQLLPQKPKPTQFQEEMISDPVIGHTTAGGVVKGHLALIQEKYENQIADLHNKIKDMLEGDRQKREDEAKEVKKNMDKMMEDIIMMNTKISSMELQALKVTETIEKSRRSRRGGGIGCTPQ